MQINLGLNMDKGMIERLICAILPAAVADSPDIKKMFSAEVEQIMVDDGVSGAPWRVTVVNKKAVACSCYGFHAYGRCPHFATAELIAVLP